MAEGEEEARVESEGGAGCRLSSQLRCRGWQGECPRSGLFNLEKGNGGKRPSTFPCRAVALAVTMFLKITRGQGLTTQCRCFPGMSVKLARCAEGVLHLQALLVVVDFHPLRRRS